MKHIHYILILVFFSCSDKTTETKKAAGFVFDSTWKEQKISEVLSISLPDSSTFRQDEVMKEYFDSCSAGIYGVDYFDTVVAEINNEQTYRAALKGYLTGMMSGAYFKSCELNIIDTSISNSSGYYITGFTPDTLALRKYPFCYMTTANSKLLWFFVFQNEEKITKETRQFFASIKFDNGKISERGFVLPKTRIHRLPDY
jgi:hypothetical protein